MKNSILLMFAVILFSSCLTQKKRASIAKEYMNDNTEELAKLCAVHFKPVIEYKPGKVVHVSDTQYVEGEPIPCPPNEKGEVVYVRGRDRVISDTVFRTDTATVRDVATERVLSDRVRKAEDRNILLEADSERYKKQRNQSYWANGILVALAIGGVILKRYLP